MPDATGALNPTTYALVAATGLGLVLGFLICWPRQRRQPRLPRTQRQHTRRGEDLLTFLAAGLATAVAAAGMWRFFSDTLDLPKSLQIPLFAFLEVAMLTSALRARRNIAEFGKAGVDGAAVWALTGMSAMFSALDADTFTEALFRLAAPLVAAWLWERGLSTERRRHRASDKRHWRVTPDRILTKIGLTETTDRTNADVDAHRRITQLARAAKHLRTLHATGAAGWRIRRATRRAERAMERAVEHAALATHPARQRALVAQLGALYNAAALADLTPAAPWDQPAPAAPTRHDLTDDELVELGADAARVQDYLASRGLDLSPADAARALADVPRLAAPPILRAVPALREVGPTWSRTSASDLVPDQSPDPIADPPTDLISDQIGTHHGPRSETHVPDHEADQTTDLPPDPIADQVPDPIADQKPDHNGTHTPTRSRTQQPTTKRTRPTSTDLLAKAQKADASHRTKHGRPISAENLARALSIGKPKALDLVQQVRSNNSTGAAS